MNEHVFWLALLASSGSVGVGAADERADDPAARARPALDPRGAVARCHAAIVVHAGALVFDGYVAMDDREVPGAADLLHTALHWWGQTPRHT